MTETSIVASEDSNRQLSTLKQEIVLELIKKFDARRQVQEEFAKETSVSMVVLPNENVKEYPLSCEFEISPVTGSIICCVCPKVLYHPITFCPKCYRGMHPACQFGVCKGCKKTLATVLYNYWIGDTTMLLVYLSFFTLAPFLPILIFCPRIISVPIRNLWIFMVLPLLYQGLFHHFIPFYLYVLGAFAMNEQEKNNAQEFKHMCMQVGYYLHMQLGFEPGPLLVVYHVLSYLIPTRLIKLFANLEFLQVVFHFCVIKLLCTYEEELIFMLSKVIVIARVAGWPTVYNLPPAVGVLAVGLYGSIAYWMLENMHVLYTDYESIQKTLNRLDKAPSYMFAHLAFTRWSHWEEKHPTQKQLQWAFLYGFIGLCVLVNQWNFNSNLRKRFA